MIGWLKQKPKIVPRFLSKQDYNDDVLLVHCMMEVLSNYVENNLLSKIKKKNRKQFIDITLNNVVTDVNDEFIRLYDWWQKNHEKFSREEITEKLHRISAIFHYMV